jgi:ABC-type nitrate/sulfonate/bicarbonate transport system substrate-binding protein
MAAAAAAIALPRGARADDATAPVEVHFASAADDDVTPLLYADQAGWFRDAGLTARIDRLNTGTAVSAAVAGGAIDVGKGSMLSLVLAHARGVPLTIIAPCSLSLPNVMNSGLLVRKDSNIHAAADLNGKIVSVPALNDMQSLSTQAWIDQHGGNSKAISFVEEPVSAVGLALDTNRIAAGTLANPALSQDLATGKYRMIGRPIEGIASRLLISAWVSNIDWASKNPAVVRKVGQILMRAGAYANGHHDQTVELIAAFSGIDPATVRTMARVVFADKLDPADIQPLIDVAVRYGAVKARFPATELFSPGAYGLSHSS